MNFFNKIINFFQEDVKSEIEIKDLIIKYLGHSGKMISWSKSTYRSEHPQNFVIFNAKIKLAGQEIWFGDIDITLEEDNITSLAEKLGYKQLEIFTEHSTDAVYTTDGITFSIGHPYDKWYHKDINIQHIKYK